MVEVLTAHGITLSEVKQAAEEWAKKELVMGPKQYYISFGGPKDYGTWVEKSIFDTKYGNVLLAMCNAGYDEY